MAKEWPCVLAVSRLALAVSGRSFASCGAHATWFSVGSGLGLTWSDTGLVRCCAGRTSVDTSRVWSGKGRIRP